jgi:hypothetical protein
MEIQRVKIYRFLAIFSLVFTGIISVRAQPVNVQQFQNTQQAQQLQQQISGFNAATNAPEIYPGEDADTGPQRILRLTPRPDYFSVLLDSQVFYSDNANFAEGAAKIGSSVFVNTVQAAFSPPDMKLGPGKFGPAFGYVSQWYNYGSHRMMSLDFDAQTAFISGRYTLGNWQFGLGCNYTRLLDQGDYAQTYSEWLPAFTAQRIFPVNDNVLFVIGNQVDYHFTSVPTSSATNNTTGSTGSSEVNNRFDDAVTVTVSWQISRNWNLQPYYRFQYSNYRYDTLQNASRNDYLNSFGVTLAYYVSKNLSIRTFFNYNIKQSDDPLTPAYHEWNGGAGAAVNFSF